MAVVEVVVVVGVVVVVVVVFSVVVLNGLILMLVGIESDLGVGGHAYVGTM